MTDYDLIGHEWFSDLYDIREQWIPAYFKDVFMSGLMRVISRFESENSFFDSFLLSPVTLIEFWMCFESAMEAQRHKQSKLNSDNKHSQIPLKTKLNLECGLKDGENIDDTKVFILTYSELPNKTWNITYSPDNNDVTCSCSMFQKLSLLCRHCLWLLYNKKFQKIPKEYIVQRWIKAAMSKLVIDKDGKAIDVSQLYSDRKSLTIELWKEVYSCVSVAEYDEEDMKFLIEKLRDVRLEMIDKRSFPATKKDKMKEMEKYVGFKRPEKLVI
ncbi:protein FAR-RED IMPAIRED RESPONSE 1-like [Silene latifolia]|uniref:protein FAR-RED IMPAIRED RESPONSE 1-like n=1 Tax=Silene latifolia TaxID=37657 RepID=UPI003D78671B